MTTDITPLAFDDVLVRIATGDCVPGFIAVDFCRALGIRNTAQALEPLDDDEKGICLTYTLGGPQELLTVTEGGAYTLVLRSRAAMTPGTRAHALRRGDAHRAAVLRQGVRAGRAAMSDKIHEIPNLERNETAAAFAQFARLLPELAANAATIARARRDLFNAYVAAGFTEPQALELCRYIP